MYQKQSINIHNDRYNHQLGMVWMGSYADIVAMQDCVHHVAHNASQIMVPKSLEEALTTDHAM